MQATRRPPTGGRRFSSGMYRVSSVREKLSLERAPSCRVISSACMRSRSLADFSRSIVDPAEQPSSGFLPDPLHTELVEHGIVRQQRHLFFTCLGDEHPVERIPVLAGECARNLTVVV